MKNEITTTSEQKSIQEKISSAIKKNKTYDNLKAIFYFTSFGIGIDDNENKLKNVYFVVDKDSKVQCIYDENSFLLNLKNSKIKIPCFSIYSDDDIGDINDKDVILSLINDETKNKITSNEFCINSAYGQFFQTDKTNAFKQLLNNEQVIKESSEAMSQIKEYIDIDGIGICKLEKDNTFSYTFQVDEKIAGYLQIKLTFDNAGKIIGSEVEYTENYNEFAKYYDEETKKFNDKIKDKTSDILKNAKITNIDQIENIKSHLNQQIKNIPELKDKVIKDQLTTDFNEFQQKLKPLYSKYIGSSFYFSFGEMINERDIKYCIQDWRTEYARCKTEFQKFVEQEKEKYQKDIKEEHISYLKDMFDNSIKHNDGLKVSHGSAAHYDVENNCIVIPQENYKRPHILQFDDNFNIAYLEVYDEKGECIGKIDPDIEFDVYDNRLKKQCSGELKDIIIFDNDGFILPPHSKNTNKESYAKFEVAHEQTANTETLKEIIKQQTLLKEILERPELQNDFNNTSSSWKTAQLNNDVDNAIDANTKTTLYDDYTAYNVNDYYDYLNKLPNDYKRGLLNKYLGGNGNKYKFSNNNKNKHFFAKQQVFSVKKDGQGYERLGSKSAIINSALYSAFISCFANTPAPVAVRQIKEKKQNEKDEWADKLNNHILWTFKEEPKYLMDTAEKMEKIIWYKDVDSFLKQSPRMQKDGIKHFIINFFFGLADRQQKNYIFSKDKTYIVVKGDTLTKIAKLRNLYYLNNYFNNHIQKSYLIQLIGR